MDNAIVISPLVAVILSLAAGFLATVFGWFAKGYLKRMDRDRTESNARMDRERAEVHARMDRERAEVLALIEQSDQRSEERHRETQAALREIRSELHDLNVRVSRLEGALDANDGSTGGSGQRSPRRNDDPTAAPAGEAEPAQGAERLDRSMVPLAGVGAGPEHSAGLAHQAVPGQNSADESGAEPNAEESPDTAR